MVIRFRLDEMLNERKLSARRLSVLAGVSTSTLSAMRQNKLERVDVATLERLCKALNCSVQDLMWYVPDATLPPPDKP